MTNPPEERRRTAFFKAVSRSLRSGPAKILFVIAAVTAAVWVVAANWAQAKVALGRIGTGEILVILLLSIAHVFTTMLAWRVLLADLGSPLRVRAAAPLFFLTQVGKYLPGGVWNVVALAEMGSSRRIPRRRTLTVMTVWWLVTILTGLILAAVAGPWAPAEASRRLGWTLALLPLFMVLTVPPILNRLVGRALTVLGRPPLEHALSWGGLLRASGWSVLAWLLAGSQVAFIAHAVGLVLSTATFALAVGGYALAWTVGFLVVMAPAGAGVREAVLGLALVGTLDTGSVAVVVLLSRIGIVLADVALALVSTARRGENGDPA